jgi:hypothetical protein
MNPFAFVFALMRAASRARATRHRGEIVQMSPAQLRDVLGDSPPPLHVQDERRHLRERVERLSRFGV